MCIVFMISLYLCFSLLLHRRQYFLLLTMGGLSELEEIAARVVHEYLNAEAVKIKIAI